MLDPYMADVGRKHLTNSHMKTVASDKAITGSIQFANMIPSQHVSAPRRT